MACLLALPAADVFTKARWNVHTWQRLRSAHRNAPDLDQDRLYRTLGPFLPARGTVGFRMVGGHDDGRTRFRLQYALVPRRLVETIGEEFVIEVGSAESPESLGHDSQFVLVNAPDADLRLFRRGSR